MPNNKGVIINVYVESKNLNSNKQTDPIKKIKKINTKLISSKPRAFKTRGYDRRAQLLGYAHELRHANAEQTKCAFNNSRQKPKKRRWLLPAHKVRVFFSWFDGIKRRWGYEKIFTEDYGDGQKRMKRKKKGICSRFCKNLRCFLKKCRVWECKNGGC